MSKRKYEDEDDGKPLTHGNKKDVSVLSGRLQSTADYKLNADIIKAKQRRIEEDIQYNKELEEREIEEEEERKR